MGFGLVLGSEDKLNRVDQVAQVDQAYENNLSLNKNVILLYRPKRGTFKVFEDIDWSAPEGFDLEDLEQKLSNFVDGVLFDGQPLGTKVKTIPFVTDATASGSVIVKQSHSMSIDDAYSDGEHGSEPNP